MKQEHLETKLARLDVMSRRELVETYEITYRRPPPLRLSDHILKLAIAYRWQEQREGGLNAETLRWLLSEKPVVGPSKRLSAGTILLREWGGREHTVVVQQEGFTYEGQRYRSLTDVARRITGQKRSGPLFFGLKKAKP